MIKRTIEISRAPAYLCVKHGQLVIRPRESEGSRDTSIPCEDIGVVVLDEPGTMITHGALSNLAACGAVSRENADVHVKRVERSVPDEGEVRILAITDKQYERMHVFWGKMRSRPEEPPHQLELF